MRCFTSLGKLNAPPVTYHLPSLLDKLRRSSTTMAAMEKGRQLPNEAKRSILNLPLVSPRSRLTQLLLPDPLTPTPSALVSVEASAPSLLRRSRGVGEGAHFTYTTPLVLPFPYELKATEDVDGDDRGGVGGQVSHQQDMESLSAEDRQRLGMEHARKEMERVERLMRPYEVSPAAVDSIATKHFKGEVEHLYGYLPKARTETSYPSARLLAVSQSAIRDCLPELDIGDAQQWIEQRCGKDSPDCCSSGPMAPLPAKDDSAGRARYELSDLLSGRLIGAIFPSDLNDDQIEAPGLRGVAEAQHQHVVKRREASLANGQADPDDGEDESTRDRWTRRSLLLGKRLEQSPPEYAGYAPWSNCYSGHQFGQWAGQLGDGRAITLLETCNSKGERWEIQLKGAGRTPYSRFADGLATLASSVREFLGSEAINALGIPTSRALCVTAVKDVPVLRESHSLAAITTRLAPIWTRVGSFEHHAMRKEWESVRMLGEFVCIEGYGWQEVRLMTNGANLSQPPWAERLIRECIARNARTVALWQVYGFMHGVMNTDNISLLGLTIDYGPFAFMDIFDRNASSNKSDGEGRYSYQMQPTAALFVMEQLVESLGVLVALERREQRAARPGELALLDQGAIKELSRQGKDAVWEEMKELFMDTMLKEWESGWRKRLALHKAQSDDRYGLIEPLLDLMDGYLDFSTTLRNLNQIEKHINLTNPNDDQYDAMVAAWLDWESVPSFVREGRQKDAKTWIQRYVERLQSENQQDSVATARELRSVNPAFVLRNWVADEVSQRLERAHDTDFLLRVLELCVNPFNALDEADAMRLEEIKRLCSVGTLLSYNMPSCSS